MSAIDDVLAHNEAYAAAFAAGAAPARPARRLAVLTCMDARINVFAALGLREGEAHIIRNAGGVVTDDVIRSLLLSQRLLGTEAVMLIQHTQCGQLTYREDELRAQLREELGEEPTFAFAPFADLEQSLRDSLARLRSSPFLAPTPEARAFLYDVATGRLAEVEGAPPD